MLSWIKWYLRLGNRGKTLVVIQLDGCMATEWNEIDRGTIVDIIKDVSTGRPGKCVKLYLVRRWDGSTFTALVDRCNDGTERMLDRFDEVLVGKIVELV